LSVLKKLLFTVMLLAFAGMSLKADEEIFRPEGNKEYWHFHSGKILSNTDGVTRVSLPFHMRLKDDKRVAVEEGKLYRLSGEFRYVGSKKSINPLVFGYSAYTADGKYIARANVLRVFKNFARVVEDAPEGSTEVVLKGNVGPWSKRANAGSATHYNLAFGVKSDNSDLPNFRLSPTLKLKGLTKQEDGSWLIEFGKPLAFDVKAGELVGFHHIGASYMNVYRGKLNSNDWQKFQGVYSTKAVGKIRDFHKGTGAVGIGIFSNQRGGAVEFRNIIIEKIGK